MKVYESFYKALKSFVAESETLRIEIVPELGGKMVSLRNKNTGKEWMLDSGGRPLTPLKYGSVFTDADMSGWDECFPTIDRCNIGDLALPDHGEVWSVPWDVVGSGDGLICSVSGRVFPYTLSRTLKIMGSRSIMLSYEVHNKGGTPLPFLWTAHPQFNVDEPTRILIPEEMRTLQCVYGGLQHTTGSTYAMANDWDIGTAVDGDGIKFYYPNPVTAAWSGLYGLQSRDYLLIKTDHERVPYWGIWIDQGMCNDRTTIALEPGIGYYDSLKRAVDNGTAVTLQPGERYTWWIQLVLGSGDWRSDSQEHPIERKP